MHKQLTLTRLILLTTLAALLLAAPVLAQEEAAEQPAEQVEVATGLSTLILLAGVGAVLAVGGAMLARDTFKKD